MSTIFTHDLYNDSYNVHIGFIQDLCGFQTRLTRSVEDLCKVHTRLAQEWLAGWLDGWLRLAGPGRLWCGWLSGWDWLGRAGSGVAGWLAEIGWAGPAPVWLADWLAGCQAARLGCWPARWAPQPPPEPKQLCNLKKKKIENQWFFRFFFCC